MHNKVKFSVIIPVYNKASVVSETIQSVLSQEYDSFELVVVNDGSTDGSEEVLNSFVDNRLRIYSIDNSGPSAARNYGILRAEGEWTVVLDADDLMLQGALSLFAKAISRFPRAEMIVSNFYDDYGKGQSIHLRSINCRIVRNPFRDWFNKILMPRAGAFACKTKILQENPYNPDIRRAEDVDLLFRLFAKTTIAFIPECTMVYRQEFSTESKSLPPIADIFHGHLSFAKEKSLWEKICLYEQYIEAKNIYPADVTRLYGGLRKRHLLVFAYHIAFWNRAFFIRKTT